MGRTRCPACGATVDVAVDIEGRRVVLEVHTDPSSDAARYRIVALNPLTVEPVSKGAAGDYYPDHYFDCPAHGAGRLERHVGRG